MAGRGGVTNDTRTDTQVWDGIVPPQCQPNPSILRLSAKLKWVRAHEPLHADIDVNKINGVGPGMPFFNAVLTKDPNFGVIGLVPCAIGGTNISEWKKGSFLYDQTVRRTQAALQGGGVIRALLWYQGESDTVNREDAELYKQRSDKFFVDLRYDLQVPMLPIIRVALASGQGPYIDIVREAQLQNDLLNVRTVDARGLPLEPDVLHLTTPAQVRLGEMMAAAFLQSMPSTIKTGPSYSDAPTNSSHNSLILSEWVGVLLVMAGMNRLDKGAEVGFEGNKKVYENSNSLKMTSMDT
ncbi:hypothetical protein LWI28_029260 [Acer negundo]|uniref:Sialate O-acetylesterase domain-containing protein n=1 Tax=Acer negundo TaxID=4023 RepID=A0AAD5JUR7_ACENE|nr:hypothetical protein LWI28_029260 [Acer negundo]